MHLIAKSEQRTFERFGTEKWRTKIFTGSNANRDHRHDIFYQAITSTVRLFANKYIAWITNKNRLKSRMKTAQKTKDNIVVVKNNPNISTYVWEEKYSSDTLTRRKITV